MNEDQKLSVEVKLKTILKKLRAPCGWCDSCKDCERVQDEAADEIERLLERETKLEATCGDLLSFIYTWATSSKANQHTGCGCTACTKLRDVAAS